MAVKVKGLDQLEAKFTKLPNETRAELRKELNSVTFSINGYIIKKLRNITGSKTVTRYEPTRTVRVSSKGQYPNSDRGNLRKRLMVGKAKDTRRGVRAEIISGAEYSAELDATRPFLYRAVKEKEKYIETRMRAAIKRSIK